MKTVARNECPLWGTEATISQFSSMEYCVVSARAGGQYKVSFPTLQRWNFSDPVLRVKLTSWLVEQRLLGVTQPEIDDDVMEMVTLRSQLRTSQRVERFFRYLDSINFRPGKMIGILGQQPDDIASICAWTESLDPTDARGLLAMLADANLLETWPKGVYAPDCNIFSLTPGGFSRLEEVASSLVATKRAFVAMWFDPTMNDAWSNGFEPAIRDAGYDPVRIDKEEHSNKIDDQIIAEIRRSRFVVADFTCGSFLADGGDTRTEVRGGVYYEAGFAQGLNIPVIWTVRYDQIGSLHFDTRQYAHIVWDDPADLRQRLRNRIEAYIPR